jgi:hypothetical protein
MIENHMVLIDEEDYENLYICESIDDEEYEEVED